MSERPLRSPGRAAALSSAPACPPPGPAALRPVRPAVSSHRPPAAGSRLPGSGRPPTEALVEPARGVASSWKPEPSQGWRATPTAGRADPAPWHPTPPVVPTQRAEVPARKPQAYLLADLTHGEVLVVTGACHTDVLEPAARPGLIRVHTELLAAQLFRDLPRKRERRDGSEASSLQEPSCLGSEWQAVPRLAVSARSGHQEVPGPPSRPPRGLGEFSGGGGGPFLPHRAGHWPRTRGAASIANAPQQSRPTCENAEASASQNEPSAEGSWGAGMQKTVLEGKGVGACGCPRAWA